MRIRYVHDIVYNKGSIRIDLTIGWQNICVILEYWIMTSVDLDRLVFLLSSSFYVGNVPKTFVFVVVTQNFLRPNGA